jgi:hypothetical protein
VTGNSATCRRLRWVAAVVFFLSAGSVSADVWKWVDAFGKTHYVESLRPIFTWVEDGRVYYSDTPDHEDAIAVQLVWHSTGTLADVEEDGSTDNAGMVETEQQRAERLEAEKRYCQRVTEIHDSYVNAPRMYKSSEDGEREYLSKREHKKAIREIAAVMKEACK